MLIINLCIPPGVLQQPALPDVQVLDQMDLAALLALPPVQLEELPPGVETYEL